MRLDTAEKYYPKADQWMWYYCTFLGKYSAPNDEEFDLGIFISKNGYVSFAIVHSDEPGDYFSGSVERFANDIPTDDLRGIDYAQIETLKRMQELHIPTHLHKD